MKALHGAFLAPMILLSLVSAPSLVDAQQRQSRPLTGFDAIEVGGGIDLFVRKGDGFVVEVQASEDAAAKIVTEVVGTTLQIKRKSPGFFHWGDAGSVYVTLPALVSLDASGGSDVKTEGTFASDNLRVGASGGSDLTIDVTAGVLHLDASGGSDLRVSGTARSAHVESSGGSDLNASALMADEVDVDSSGGSDLAIGVRQKITGEASGGSDVTYTGQPASVSVNTSGGAELHHRS